MAKEYRIDELIGSEELYHHGIKGQKWGVRRYQNKDGSLTKAGLKRYKDDVNSKERTIKEGTELQTVTSRKYDHSKTSRLYTSYTDYDKNMYKDLMGNFMYEGKGYNNTFVVKKDMKIASDKQVVDSFVKIAKENPTQTARDMAKAYNANATFNSRTADFYKKKISEINDSDSKKARKLAEEFVGTTIMSNKAKVTNENFYGYLVKQGFDAISDTNDRKGTAQDPLIILNLDKIGLTGSVKMTKDDLEAYSKYTMSKEFKKSKYDASKIQRQRR